MASRALSCAVVVACLVRPGDGFASYMCGSHCTTPMSEGTTIMCCAAASSSDRTVTFRDSAGATVACGGAYAPGATYTAHVSSTEHDYVLELSGGSFASGTACTDGLGAAISRVCKEDGAALTAPTDGSDLVLKAGWASGYDSSVLISDACTLTGPAASSPAPSAAPTPFSCESDDPSYDSRVLVDRRTGLLFYWRLGATSLSAKVAYYGTAYVAWGASRDFMMVGSEAVMGLPDAGTVLKYDMSATSSAGVSAMSSSKQTLAGASVTQADGWTTVTFEKLLVEDGEIAIARGVNKFIWAVGNGNAKGYHPYRGGLSLDLTTCSASVKTLKPVSSKGVRAHGILMIVAWAWLIPSGIVAAVLKKLIGSAWIKIHMGVQCGGFLVAVVGIAVVIAAVADSDARNHFAGNHPVLGIVVMVIALLNIAAGAFRPHNADEEHPVKTAARKAFERGHRAAGLIVFAVATVTMVSGINRAFTYGYIGRKLPWTLATYIPLVTAVGISFGYYTGLLGIGPSLVKVNDAKQAADLDEEKHVADIDAPTTRTSL